MRVTLNKPETCGEVVNFATIQDLKEYIESGFAQKKHVVREIKNLNSDGSLPEHNIEANTYPWHGFLFTAPPSLPPEEPRLDETYREIPNSTSYDDPFESLDEVKSLLLDVLEMKMQWCRKTKRARLSTKNTHAWTQPMDTDGWVYVPWPFQTYIHVTTIYAATHVPSFGLDEYATLHSSVRAIEIDLVGDELFNPDNLLIIENRQNWC